MKSKKHKINLIHLVISLIVCASVLVGCDVGEFEGNNNDLQEDNSMNGDISGVGDEETGLNRLPQVLAEIPNEYRRQSDSQGVLHDLYYQTYESMSYKQKRRILTKHAVVYIPYGYSQEVKYDVFYLMHGGWSNDYSDKIVIPIFLSIA